MFLLESNFIIIILCFKNFFGFMLSLTSTGKEASAIFLKGRNGLYSIQRNLACTLKRFPGAYKQLRPRYG